jgi:hypothetical protein
MLKVTKGDKRIGVETAAVVFEWDLERGGQLVRCELKASNGSRRTIIEPNHPAPNLTLGIGTQSYGMADGPTEAAFVREDEECFVFTTKTKFAKVFTVEQRYDVFREGVVFCELLLTLNSGKKIQIRNAELGFTLDVLDADHLRGNYISRDPYPKQDVTCVHVLARPQVCMPRNEKIDIPHLLMIYGLDVGWDDSRYFSNRVEMIIEDSTSIGHGMLGRTSTVAGPAGRRWELRWKLCERLHETLRAPFFYRNRWALVCSAARTTAGAQADRARTNNVMAARLCHVMYPYVRPGQEWPWCSVPMRQTFYQDVQLATGNPSVERIEEAAALGVNTLILHQFWMNNGGSNGEPAADYKAFDPVWLKAFTDRAHARGMRVMFYTRGIERYMMYSDFFEHYLRRNADGIYMDWALPFGLGYCKTSALHFSAYDYFMFTRAVRRRVGDHGMMVAHSAVQTAIASAAFDAFVVGEFSVMHAGLLAEPEISASYAMLSGCGVNLISGNSADRAIFSSQVSSAYCAGLGYSAHPFMEPNKPFAQVSAYLHPVWNLWRSLGADPVQTFNPAVGHAHTMRWSKETLHPILYRAANGNSLVMVTNLGDRKVSGTVELDFAALELPSGAQMEPLKIPGTHPLTAHDNVVRLKDMPPWFYGGLLIRKNR